MGEGEGGQGKKGGGGENEEMLHLEQTLVPEPFLWLSGYQVCGP